MTFLTDKYPKATKFLQETGMTLDQALEYFEKKERSGVDHGPQR